MNPLARFGVFARRGFGRVVPDPFAIAVLLTGAVMVASVAVGHSPADTLHHWNRSQGLWSLLVFSMQMCLMLVLGSALAAAPSVKRAITWVVSRASTPRRLVGLTSLVAMGLAVVNWSLGLIGGAMLALEAGRQVQRRGWSVHYPLLCAAGYSGLMVWHGGLSGSAPLKVTSQADLTEVLGAELAAQVGPIPLTETLFSSLNFWVSGGLIVLGPLVFMALCPSTDPDPQPIPERLAGQHNDGAMLPTSPPASSTVERVEQSYWVLWLLALPMAAAVILYFLEHGVGRLNFNTVNLTLWCSAMVLHGRPHRFVDACRAGVIGCTGVILQFPLYAGIMGVMAGSGLSQRLSAWFASVGASAFELMTFVSAGLLNLFVPSGGGQWAVQGPILMAGALDLDLAPGRVVMALAYGDQWTNMLQPFWALPLLAMTGVQARHIVGYTATWMLVGGAWVIGVMAVLA